MKKFIVFLFLFVSLTLAQFKDAAPAWAENAVLELVELGIIVGYPDGYFKGEQAISRFEAATMLSRLLTALETRYLKDINARLTTLEISVERLDASNIDDLWTTIDHLYSELDDVKAASEELMGQVPLTEAFHDSVTVQVNSVVQSLAALEQVVYENQLMFERAIADSDTLVLQTLREEIDDKIAELRTTLRNELEAYVDSRLTDLQTDVATAVAGVEASLLQRIERQDAVIEELRSQQLEFLDAQNTVSSSLPRITTELRAGFVGSSPYAKFGVAFAVTGSEVTAQLATTGIEARGLYGVTPNFYVGGRFRSNYSATVSGVVFEGRFSPALRLSFETAFSDVLELSLKASHDGSVTEAVIPGLTLSAQARLAFRETTDLLIDADASYALNFGAFTLSPGVIFRNVSSATPYRAIIPALDFEVNLEPLTLYGGVKYGFVTPLTVDVPSRTAPEALLGLRYNNVALEGFMESGLLEVGDGDFMDDPTTGTAYRVGVRATVYTHFGSGE